MVTATRYYAFNGGTVAQRTSGGLTWLMPDRHGTDQIAIDDSSQAITQRRFKPYGEARGTTVPWVNDKGYLRGTADPTGLTHLGAREYDPGIGRFISPDPVFDATDPQQINGYAYSNDSPVTLADPSGLIAHRDQDDGGSYDSTTNVGGVPVTNTYDPKTGNTTVSVAGLKVKTKYGTDFGADTAGEDWIVRDPYEWARKVAAKYAQTSRTMEPTSAILSAMQMACVEAHSGCDPNFTTDLQAAAAMRSALRKRHCDDACFAKEQLVAGLIAQGFIEGGNVAGHQAGGRASRKGLGTQAEETLKGLASGKIRPTLCATANSFDGHTPVLMADGSAKPIDQVDVGDKVVATDPQSRTTGARKVVALHRDRDLDLTDVTVTDGRGHRTILHTTPHHPFWDETANAWVDAAYLRTGDHLYTGTGAVETVVTVRSFHGFHAMYNFTVDGLHTYYVMAGTTPVLVHNEGGDPNPWTISVEQSTAIMRGGPFGANYYKQVPDSNGDVFWWSPDRAGHGGSAWKVYKETATGLEWYADADAQGNFIANKYKGDTGRSISFDDLRSVNARGLGSCVRR
jgi:RHS repeat-associated protein